jgi:4-alpha-glucanotransferase
MSCHWPHTWVRNCVAYTGTHDNDTARGWYEAEPGPTETPESWAAERQRARDYLASSGTAISQDLIRAVYASVADRCVIPLQDLLDLDTTARMNIPGVAEGNWGWRVRGDHLSAELAHRLRHLVRTYARDGR